jgi:outer membrane protein assembly factor BamB
LLKLSKLNLNKMNRALFITLGAIGVAASGCSARNIHKELGADTDIMVRQWTLGSRKSAGETGQPEVDFSNPIFFENTLIYGNVSTGLVALYPGMMTPRWTMPIQNGVVSEIEESKGAVYFTGGDGYLYSVAAETGRVNWRYDLHTMIASRPTINAGRLYVTTGDDTVYAFDAGTGKWLWHYRRRSGSTASIRGGSQPLVDGNEVLAGLSDGFLVALSVQEGQLKWERKLHQGNKFTDVDAHPVLENGILYVPSYDGSLYALKRQSGEVIWRFDAGGSKQIKIEGDRIYLPSTDGNIYALQKSNAKVLWKFELDGGVPTQLAADDKYLFLGSSQQYLYAIDKATGQGVYRFDAGNGSGFFGSPAFDPAARRLYFLSAGGNLYAFSVRPATKKIRPHGGTDGYRI